MRTCRATHSPRTAADRAAEHLLAAASRPPGRAVQIFERIACAWPVAVTVPRAGPSRRWDGVTHANRLRAPLGFLGSAEPTRRPHSPSTATVERVARVPSGRRFVDR